MLYIIAATLFLTGLIIIAVVRALSSILPELEREKPFLKFPNFKHVTRFFSRIRLLWENVIINEIRLSIAIFILAILVVCGYMFFVTGVPKVNEDFKGGILVEMVGMLFDMVLVLIILTALNSLGERKRDVKRYKEELDDFRGWHDPEAKYRVAGILNRLEGLGEEKINYEGLHLGNAQVKHIRNALQSQDVNPGTICLSGANIREPEIGSLAGIVLMGINMKDTTIVRFNLEACDLSNSDLSGAHIWECNMCYIRITHTNLRGVELKYVQLRGADMTGADLRNAYIPGSDFSNAALFNADLRLARFHETKMNGCDLRWVRWDEAVLVRVDLENAKVQNKDWFETLKKSKVAGIDEIVEKYHIPPQAQSDSFGRKFFVVRLKEEYKKQNIPK